MIKMDLELAEEFFVDYLKKKKLDYEKKDRIYVVKLDRVHKRWYDTEFLRCTFDNKVAKEKNVALLGVGNIIFDSMLTQYLDHKYFSNLRIKKDTNALMDVNERLHELDKDSVSYKIDTKDINAVYFFFNIVVKSAKQKQSFQVPLFFINGKFISGQGFEHASVEDRKEPLKVGSEISLAIDEIPNQIQKELDEIQKEHEKEMKELNNIKMEYSDQKYIEIQKKEKKMKKKIEDLRERSLNARNFATRKKYVDQIKTQERKLKEFQDANKDKKAEIKEEFGEQSKDIDKRDIFVEADLIAYARVDMQIFTINFEDGDSYYYIPAVKRFIKA